MYDVVRTGTEICAGNSSSDGLRACRGHGSADGYGELNGRQIQVIKPRIYARQWLPSFERYSNFRRFLHNFFSDMFDDSYSTILECFLKLSQNCFKLEKNIYIFQFEKNNLFFNFDFSISLENLNHLI